MGLAGASPYVSSKWMKKAIDQHKAPMDSDLGKFDEGQNCELMYKTLVSR